MIFFSRLEFVPAQINGQKNTIAARDRGLWVGCTAVLLYCCTEIPVRCRQMQYVLHLSTPPLRTWYAFFLSLCPWRLKSSLTEDGRGPLAPARPEPLYLLIVTSYARRAHYRTSCWYFLNTASSKISVRRYDHVSYQVSVNVSLVIGMLYKYSLVVHE